MQHATSDKPLTMEQLILIAGGHTAFQLLWAGVELGLFEHLSRTPGADRAAIEEALGLAPQPARILLIGLTALKLIEKQDGGYRNAALTEKMLVGEGSATPILGWQRHIVYPGLEDFSRALREGANTGLERFPGPGNTLYQRLSVHPELERVFQDAMSALSAQANQHLLEHMDFSRFRHLVDVGGGDGTNAITLARKYPQLQLTVFDSASVCEIATRKIAAAGLQDRIDTHPGDMFEDPFPEGVDAILFSHIFTIWSLEKNTRLLEKSHQALQPGGSVLVFGMMGDDDDSGPLSTALGSPYFLAIATGEGMLYAWKDYEDCFRKAGFERIERIAGMPLDHGVVVGTK
ncbi:methyltransferase [Thiohalobacter sp. IOR34]|uniref:methyltransferase n=1 Tax=Thiohalobacter sp. IOR34 TaxID=3057176 RepID=UPI0025AF05EA|nr:methyltransferase [Thiohalobacter sp. IOR34]WJW74471.1 methyltransferase [Thiohalobacter sp. IOR34]